ncbi:MAG TPA: RDD family protein [Herbaspirillum sp.]
MAMEETTNMMNAGGMANGEGAQGRRYAPAISPLWKRAVAYFLDWILLAVAGMCLGFLLFDALAGIGVWGGAIGFAIAMLYFGICDSNMRNGQSLGKVAMRIRVASRNGAPLPLPKAFVRAAILLVPYFLVGIPFDLTAHLGASVVLSVLIFGTAFGLGYLLLFNRGTRQSLQDLAVGAYVVRADINTPAGTPLFHPLARVHKTVVALLFIVAGVLPVVGAQLTAKEPFVSLLALQNRIAAEPGVARANVTDGATAHPDAKEGAGTAEGSAKGTGRSLSIQVALKSKALFEEPLADRIARIALDNPVAAGNKDAIAVTLSYGYDIGIASAQTAKVFTHSPAEWRARLGQN